MEAGFLQKSTSLPHVCHPRPRYELEETHVMRTALAFALLASAGSAAVFVADDKQPPAAPQPSNVDEGLAKRKVRIKGEPQEGAPAAANPAPRERKTIDNIEAALEQPSFADFSETPLAAALQFMSTQHNIRIHIDESGLANAMVDRDSPITLKLVGVRLSLIFDLLFEPLNLDYTIRDNILFVSSRERIENMRETVVMRIGDILPAGDAANEAASRFLELIKENVDRDQWVQPVEQGGLKTVAGGAVDSVQNSIQYVEDARSFVISSNDRTRRKVSKLLSDLRAAKIANGMPVKPDANERIAAR
jgi:hypothetical protein